MEILKKHWEAWSAIIFVVGFFPTFLQAEVAPPSTNAPAAATPAAKSDPFIKKDAPAPVDETGPVCNLVVTFEVYNLNQSDGARLIQENEADQGRYDHLRDLVKEGKARLDAVLCGAVKSGEQTETEQIDVVSYTYSFKTLSGKEVIAKELKRRDLGYRLVLKADANPNKEGCDMQFFFEHTILRGFTELHLNNDSGPFTAAYPQFNTERVNTIPPFFPYEKIRFLGTFNPVLESSVGPSLPQATNPVKEPEMRLVFGKVSQVQLAPGTSASDKPASFEHQFSFYSMDRDQARQILSQKQKMDSAYQAVQSLVKTNEAKLEHLTIIRTNSDRKANCDEVSEMPILGWEADGTSQVLDMGYSEELLPSFSSHAPFLSIDISKSELMRYLGNLPVEGVNASFNQNRPMFGIQHRTTKINSALGEHELLGTFSPAEYTGKTGQIGDGRVWLEFLRTTAVNP